VIISFLKSGYAKCMDIQWIIDLLSDLKSKDFTMCFNTLDICYNEMERQFLNLQMVEIMGSIMHFCMLSDRITRII
jgi:hypothetical protein